MSDRITDPTLTMRGRKSRNKGAAGEREFSKLCREYGFQAERTAQRRGKNGGEPDIIGLPGMHVEVKRCESLSLYPAMEQAKRDAKPGDIPIVAHRRNSKEWLIVMCATDALRLIQESREAQDD